MQKYRFYSYILIVRIIIYRIFAIKLNKMKENLSQLLITKGNMELDVYQAALDLMKLFKNSAEEFNIYFKNEYPEQYKTLSIKYIDKNSNLFQINFASDVLIFMLHTNIFEFSRNHEVMNTPYIKEDKERSYCGMISIYNFLADSLNNIRVNDIGYLVGRVMVNKDRHYYVEGKRELAQILNNFSVNEFSQEAVDDIFYSAMKYSINFDLLLPDFDVIKFVTVNDMMQMENQIVTIPTAKRLGFTFDRDNDIKNNKKK